MQNTNLKLPPVNKRIKKIVNNSFDGSVRNFALAMGIQQYQKIYRLFFIDKRNGKFPTPSTATLAKISNTFDIPLGWLQYGEEEITEDDLIKKTVTSKELIDQFSKMAEIITAQQNSISLQQKNIESIIVTNKKLVAAIETLSKKMPRLPIKK